MKCCNNIIFFFKSKLKFLKNYVTEKLMH